MPLTHRALAPAALLLLSACAQQSGNLVLQHDQQDNCPLTLRNGQQLTLSLPSEPTTGYRWEVRDAGAPVLRSLGPEVYSSPEEDNLVGAAGVSTWRFEAQQPGQGTLSLAYKRPWETDVEPIDSFSCAFQVD